MARNNQQFTTIRTEGALLPPDILQRIVSQKVDGMRPADYHLPEGFKTTEAITQSWDMLKKHWKSFQDAKEQLAETDTGTSMTNERWLLPLFRELDYGRLTTETAPVIEERTYPIERFYNNTPIHLIGWNLTLDRRTKGARGAATSSPHSMVQEYLNRSESHLWSFVSNGRQLRLLRDNVALSRQAYVEFDLEAMMEGEVYSDFAILWMLCHQSRVEAEKTEDCWLEKWSKLARKEGTRVLNNLRTGVADAIEALGRGFLAHPRNDELRRKLQESGCLSKDDFYRQLLRIVYRLLFLFVAEDRELLHPSDVEEKACELYRNYYSTSRLRDMSLKLRGSKHGDLWHSLSLVFAALGKNEGCPQLGLIGLGSFLWNTKSVADLAGPHEATGDAVPVQIANDDLLSAIRALAYVEQDRVLRSVDYRNLGSEELGSVYESLLELIPDMQIEARHFELRAAAGNERKTSGSYYTPDSLVQCLLDSSLDPVVDDRLKGKKGEAAEDAILSMTVCDPACGSGHFLIAAAHRLARHLARVRTGDSEPSPEDHQHALRDVIGRCIYGVDINPMAVELCKVSLWIEAIEPGKPLSFLESHIQCGNSLLGTTPKLLADGIPDGAFKPIEGDDKKVVSELKNRNKAERRDRIQGQGLLFSSQEAIGGLASQFTELSELDDSTVDAVAAKERRHEELVASAEYQNATLIADTWCSAFLWRKDGSEEGKLCPTDRDLADLTENRVGASSGLKAGVKKLVDQYQCFHWHLAFPDVFVLPEEDEAENEQTGWSCGFDVVLGNPPWDKLTPDSKEFFSQYNEQVRFANKASERALVNELLKDEAIASAWEEHRRKRFCQVAFIKESGFHTMFAPGNLGKGDLNTYRFFLESALRTVSPSGAASQVVPEGFYNGANAAAIREALFDKFVLKNIYGFENAKEVWFDGIDSRMKFCIYSVHGDGHTESFQAAFNIRSPNQLSAVQAGESLCIPVSLVREFSPDALSLLEFRSQRDIDISRKMYECQPKLGDESAGEPLHSQSCELHMTNNAALFCEDPVGIPLYEGRMIGQYDHRAKGYVSGRARASVWQEFNFGSPNKTIQPQWRVMRDQVRGKNANRVGRYRMGYGWVASPTNERSLIAGLLPRECIAGNAVPTIIYEPEFEWMYIPWLATANSFTLDFLVRMKVSLNLTFTLLKSLPFPRSSEVTDVVRRLAPSVLQLCCTSEDMIDYWGAMANLNLVAPSSGTVPGCNDPLQRRCLRALVDAIVARDVFDVTREELAYILTTFPGVEEHDVKQFGDFRTAQLVLSAFDQLANATNDEILTNLGELVAAEVTA